MKMIVKKQFRPGGSGSPQTNVGDEVEATSQQRKLWKALKWADDAPEKPKAAPPKYQPKVVEPEPVPVAVKRPYYRRRDMTAETPE